MNDKDQTEKPDPMEQFARVLDRYSNAGELVKQCPDADRDSTLLLASGMFCVAAELRRIHDVLHEINERDETRRSLEVA